MSILLEELNEAFNLNEERVNNKEYLFRGISDSNYSEQQESALKSRFFSYEITQDVSKFGDIVVFELLDDSQNYNYEESVFDFCDEYDLLDVPCAELENLYGISTLEEADGMGFHDEYHSYQIVATDFLENNTDYKGIVWYEYMDDINYQVQIWDFSILRRLKRAEAQEVVDALAQKYSSCSYNPYGEANHEDILNAEQYWRLKDDEDED